MQTGIRGKIVGAAALPFIAYLVSSGISLSKDYSVLSNARSTQRNFKLLQAASHLIHEVQKERAATVGYIGGELSPEALASQQKSSEEAFSALDQSTGESSVDPVKVTEGLKRLRALAELRPAIREKSVDTRRTIEAFTGTISGLTAIESSAADGSQIQGIPVLVRAIGQLEMTKELMGRLRANVFSLLQSDSPITAEQLALVVQLKGGISTNLGKDGLSVTPASKAAFDSFVELESWKSSAAAVDTLIARSKQGKYGQDPKAFYTALTAAIDSLYAVIGSEMGELAARVENARSETERGFFLMIAFVLLVITAMSTSLVVIIRAISRPIQKAIEELGENAVKTSSSAEQLGASSTQLASAAHESASSVQETSASLEEVSSMIRNSADHAAKAAEVSVRSEQTAHRGKEVAQEVMGAIQGIETSNQDIMRQVQAGNRKIGQIVDLITEIGQKTKVINDIVFQTKLLSFNASVEAARAGEHGKGFAVVAEEVGNLAQMSGNAAKEITTLLDSSTEQVKSVIAETSSEVERLVLAGARQVARGVEITQQCQRALEEIVGNVTEVNQLVASISTACSEQTTGIAQISQAVSQIDQATQQNSAVASQTEASATELTTQASSLRAVVDRLSATVEGRSPALPSSPEVQEAAPGRQTSHDSRTQPRKAA